MGFMQISYHGHSIRKMCQMNVCFPDSAEFKGPFPVMWLLHGYSDDHTAWTRRTSIERYAASHGMIVAMPDGHHGFYTDAQGGLAYERNLIEDAMGTVDRLFHTKKGRMGRCISGLSMGGYGALKLALKRPDLFASVTSHSGLGCPKLRDRKDPMSWELRQIFGTKGCKGTDNDCFTLAEKIDRKKLPAIRIDCGVDDFLIENNREMHRHLDRLGIPHEYQEFPGAHSWEYWDEHIRESIAFHARNLKIKGLR
jgi:S-formylglutathione hydrolase FrmB